MLEDLEEINLTANKIENIPNCGMKKLREYYVVKNSLKNISQVNWEEYQNLETLDLNTNQIKEIPSSIIEMKNLTTLSLSMNEIDEFPLFFADFSSSIAILVLSGNYIQELPHLNRTIPRKLNLTILDLSFNKISKIEPKFFEIFSVEYLFISNNSINVLPMLPQQIKVLIMRNNKFTDVSQINLFADYPQLGFIDASNNSFDGVFNLNWMVGMMNLYNNSNLRIESYQFDYPMYLEYNKENVLRCSSIYSSYISNNRASFNLTTRVKGRNLIMIDPSVINYSNCQCIFGKTII